MQRQLSPCPFAFDVSIKFSNRYYQYNDYKYCDNSKKTACSWPAHTCAMCGDDPRNAKCDMILSPANSDRRSRFSVSIINSFGLLLCKLCPTEQLYHLQLALCDGLCLCSSSIWAMLMHFFTRWSIVIYLHVLRTRVDPNREKILNFGNATQLSGLYLLANNGYLIWNTWTHLLQMCECIP